MSSVKKKTKAKSRFPIVPATEEAYIRRLEGNIRGGYNRVAAMTPKQLSAACRKASLARWGPQARQAKAKKV